MTFHRISFFKILREQCIYALLGIVVGLLAGVSSWALLESLNKVTKYRIDNNWFLYLLPIAGFVVAAVYHHFGKRSHEGNGLIIEQIHEPTEWIPRRMAPFVFIGTVISHLFGASVGREGTAIQMSGSLTDSASRILHLNKKDRRIMLIASIAGGFGSVFGVPLAGTVFAMEVQSVGRTKYKAVIPALVAAFFGNFVVHVMQYHHTARPQLKIHAGGMLFPKIALMGIACGLASILFIELTHRIQHFTERFIGYKPLRAAIGGIAIIALALLFSRDYLGLSLPLINQSIAGHSFAIYVPLLKIIFTAICLGCAFPGGEVTPLFVIGATLGSALAHPLGISVPLAAAVGFVAVFAAAANTPLASTVMGAELFGLGTLGPMAMCCIVAYIFSHHRGIYTSRLISPEKSGFGITGIGHAKKMYKRRRIL